MPQPDDSGLSMLEGEAIPIPLLVVRCTLGGVLMGLANLVPGISGGTMLLAAGVYPAFIGAIAELSTLHFRMRSLISLGVIAGTAALAILLLAGTMKALVIEQRWIMYSLFIGLTFGGVPLVWRMARPATPGLVAGGVVAFAAMCAMQFGLGGTGGGGANTLLLLLSGLAGASAMILPGVSGGYLLLLLGQYEPILGSIDQVKTGLLGSAGQAADFALVLDAMTVVVPVGIGVVIGIVGVSNLLRWLLRRHPKPTLGALLGLLFGAVVGLFPFQQPVAPQPGDVIKGRTLSASELAEVDPEDWRLERFSPGAGQVGTSAALILLGFGATMAIARIGGSGDEEGSG
jgi:putative membrane protein